MPAPPETEKGFLAAVRELAVWRGWHVYHPYDSRRSPEGYPDLTLSRYGRLIFAELKTEKGRVTAAQETWLSSLGEAAEQAGALAGMPIPPLILVRLWRPSDWPEIEEELR